MASSSSCLFGFTSGISVRGAGIFILAMALLGMDEIHTMNALKALLTNISS